MDVPGKLRYQREFLPSVSPRKLQSSLYLSISLTILHLNQELREMLAALSLKRTLDTTTLPSTGERKPVEGECLICFHDFETEQETTWCRTSTALRI